MTLDELLAAVAALPTVRTSETDGEEADGTPRSWRDRPYVSRTKLERLLREHWPHGVAGTDALAGLADYLRAVASQMDVQAPSRETTASIETLRGWADAMQATRGVAVRCPLCGYQHGHAIGCANNPVDIALAAGVAVPHQLKDAHGMPGFIDIGGGLVVQRDIVDRIAAALGVQGTLKENSNGR